MKAGARLNRLRLTDLDLPFTKIDVHWKLEDQHSSTRIVLLLTYSLHASMQNFTSFTQKHSCALFDWVIAVNLGKLIRPWPWGGGCRPLTNSVNFINVNKGKNVENGHY